MIHSFLLAGQSNMAGRGIIGQVPPISDERLLVLRNGRWQPMYQPVNGDRPFSGVCLAESFALRYAQEHGVQVGLIPCADGGASLLQWREGGLLFDHALYQARLANRTSTVAGILWHQGEAECAPENYPLAEARLRYGGGGRRGRAQGARWAGRRDLRDLSLRERLFVGWIGPRGIVAAAWPPQS